MEFIYTDDLTPQEYSDLRSVVGWHQLSERQSREGLLHTTFVMCVRLDGKAIAMGRVLYDYGFTAYIGDIIVLPEYQGMGIGKNIVNKLVAKVLDCTESGEKVMFFLDAVKGKEPFYEKLGFTRNPNERAGHGMRMDIIKE